MTHYEWVINQAYELANDMAKIYGDLRAIDYACEWIRQHEQHKGNAAEIILEFRDCIMRDWGHVADAKEVKHG